MASVRVYLFVDIPPPPIPWDRLSLSDTRHDAVVKVEGPLHFADLLCDERRPFLARIRWKMTDDRFARTRSLDGLRKGIRIRNPDCPRSPTAQVRCRDKLTDRKTP